MTKHYLLSVGIEVPFQQSITVRMEDLNLPASVIDAGKARNFKAARVNLLKQFVEEHKTIKND